MSAAKPGEIRQARSFLQKRGYRSSEIAPHHFASASKELGKNYDQTLKYMSLLLSGGSGNGPSPIATANDNRLDPAVALGEMTPTQKAEYENVGQSQ